ncbi:NAD(P)/FAD-dependent oxidoreductase [Brevundimonas sp.]|uniref:flavin monoamine oxidase family protein n=1 Tax=Brevundimonas sp. TaxID=1871086 RepID=UPI002D35BD54|nr:NAD(P)/FAD-dependent oxidoreductase [Brevundimonas sp.]HYC97286.1 NAD(P)/FAD-dependent oxidoreductase [Brevundimonas sp.]
MSLAAPPSSVDVAVIGAGAAGIAAARALAGTGLSTVVLEARDRIGGRAHTIVRDGHALDMGCGWLHSADENPLARLAEGAGFTLDRTRPPWESQAFNHEMSAGEQAEFRAAFAAFEDRVAEAAARGEEGPASILFEPGNRWNPRIDAISGALNGARFAEVSIRDYDAYRDTGVNWRVAEGYGRLVERLGAGVPLVTDCAVSRVDRSGPVLRLETAKGGVEARALILTLPTDLIAAEAVRFDPPLPDLMEAAASLPLGLASKLHMTVTGAEDFPKDSQLWGRADTADTAGYHLRPFGRPMIEARFGGDIARQLEADGEAAFFAFASDELVHLLGSDMRRRIAPVAASMWGADPWSRGAYSHALPGHAGDRARLKAPVERRIFIAGEATSEVFYGTAHGAWLEGGRAAQEVLTALEGAGPA